jgi:hypothetical protein
MYCIRGCRACDRVADGLIHQVDDLVDLGLGDDQWWRECDKVWSFANEQTACSGRVVNAPAELERIRERFAGGAVLREFDRQ